MMEKPHEVKPDTGVLFFNKEKVRETQPTYIGNLIDQDGNKRQLCAWINVSRLGEEYLNVKVRDIPPVQPDATTKGKKS